MSQRAIKNFLHAPFSNNRSKYEEKTMRTLLALVTIAFCAVLSAAAIASAQRAKSDREPRARDLGVPFEGTPGPAQFHHRCERRRSRLPHADLRRRKIGSRQWSSAHRSHRHFPARQSLRRSRFRRMVHRKWQRRNDRHHLGRRIRISLRPSDDHQHPQRGRGA